MRGPYADSDHFRVSLLPSAECFAANAVRARITPIAPEVPRAPHRRRRERRLQRANPPIRLTHANEERDESVIANAVN